MESPHTRFSKTVEDYRRYRPSYPDLMVEWLAERAGLAVGAEVLDVGCGTGITSRLFADHGYRVTGVDPNEDMLAPARAEGGATYLNGTAEQTGTPDDAFDLTISGQAFHWFEIEPAIRELKRTLRPGGVSSAFWNVRIEGGHARDYAALLAEHSIEYCGTPQKSPTLMSLRAATASMQPEEKCLTCFQELDFAGLLGRARSSSYVAHGVRDRPAFEAGLREIFERYAEDGRVRLEYETIAVLWRPH